MRDYDRMKMLFYLNQGKKVKTDKYEGEVCGFHYKWADGDTNQLIIAITKEKARPGIGIKYMLQGDVYISHENNQLGYDYTYMDEMEKFDLVTM